MIVTGVNLDLSGLKYAKGSGINKAIRIALSKAAAPVKSAVISSAPSDLGNLKKSIKIKTKYYSASQSWGVIVGPSKSYSAAKRKAKKRKGVGVKRPRLTAGQRRRRCDPQACQQGGK